MVTMAPVCSDRLSHHILVAGRRQRETVMDMIASGLFNSMLGLLAAVSQKSADSLHHTSGTGSGPNYTVTSNQSSPFLARLYDPNSMNYMYGKG